MVPTEAAYQNLVRAQFGTTLGDAALAQYPASRFPTPRAAFVRVTSDARFVCPSREIARAADAGQTQPVYRYFFQYGAPLPYGLPSGLFALAATIVLYVLLYRRTQDAAYDSALFAAADRKAQEVRS